jgi:hypothetical protein
MGVFDVITKFYEETLGLLSAFHIMVLSSLVNLIKKSYLGITLEGITYKYIDHTLLVENSSIPN